MVRVPPKPAPRLPGPRGAPGPALRRGSPPPAQGIGASLHARWVPWREHSGPVRARVHTRTRSHRACLQGRVGGRRRVPGSPALGPAWGVRPARVALERACARALGDAGLRAGRAHARTMLRPSRSALCDPAGSSEDFGVGAPLSRYVAASAPRGPGSPSCAHSVEPQLPAGLGSVRGHSWLAVAGRQVAPQAATRSSKAGMDLEWRGLVVGNPLSPFLSWPDRSASLFTCPWSPIFKVLAQLITRFL